ncbi:GntR family transcriptional regulator [Deefgea salmonis]|uniref:GntR family transcriptional regulator n=1 Tax=Deefgea salmonis TaxID=2875502 RepID=A0ABS8BN51_9NEIS|nr:GntR family transcriptional regulator [Deefgea salmonis]MCB5197155.1 GntR family transcriptional regulator [Deefgea salmonis]
MADWNNQSPIYLQLAEHLSQALLDGQPQEGQAMPSVRLLAAEYGLNPLTVNRALQAMVEAGLLESRRGLGMFVLPQASERLRAADRARFLSQEWPLLRAKLQRLGISASDLDWHAKESA